MLLEYGKLRLKFLVLMVLIAVSTLNLAVGTKKVSAYVGTLTSYYTTHPPTLDGDIGMDEWREANVYQGVGTLPLIADTGSGGWVAWRNAVSDTQPLVFDVYLMHDEAHFYVGVQVLDAERNDRDRLCVYFDEGDDGCYGSGSHDGRLIDDQEDCKTVYGDGRRYDGNFGPPGCLWALFDRPIDFSVGVGHHVEVWDFELKMPFRGVEGAMEDLSDLTIAAGDVPGILFTYLDADRGLRYYYPSWVRGHIFLDAELWHTLRFLSADVDDDGLIHGEELDLGTEPFNPDTDGDGLEDGGEVGLGTDPLRLDSDGDGLGDGEEVMGGWTDPLRSDTDGDLWVDHVEVRLRGFVFHPTSIWLPNAFIVVGISCLLVALKLWLRRRGKVRARLNPQSNTKKRTGMPLY